MGSMQVRKGKIKVVKVEARKAALKFFKEKKKSAQEVINMFSITSRSELVKQIIHLDMAIKALSIKKTDCPYCLRPLKYDKAVKGYYCGRFDCALPMPMYTKKQISERVL